MEGARRQACRWEISARPEGKRFQDVNITRIPLENAQLATRMCRIQAEADYLGCPERGVG
jgi:hypothetical protein